MKNISLILIILLVSACSSIPKSNESGSSNTLIQKPKFNYKIKSLPQTINVFFFLKDENIVVPKEIQGFIANSFFYKLVKKFFPKIFIKLIIKFIKFIKYYYKVFISIFNIENNNKRVLNNLRRSNIIFNISELDNFKEVCEKY